MLTFFENKSVCTLVVLIALGTIIGVMSNLALDAGRPFFAQDVVRTMLAPSQWTFSTIFAVGDQAARLVKSRSALLSENARLRREILRLRRENSLLRESAAENARLRDALQLRQSTGFKMVAAEVISRKQSSWFDTATLGKGRNAGIREGAAVISPSGGLVGQVMQVDPYTAQVAALTDAGAMVRRSRCWGMLSRQGVDELVLEYLPKDADVKNGDLIVSSGKGRVIPKGFPIGRVVRVARNKSLGMTSALVRPNVRLDAVEQVFVVEHEQTGTR